MLIKFEEAVNGSESPSGNYVWINPDHVVEVVAGLDRSTEPPKNSKKATKIFTTLNADRQLIGNYTLVMGSVEEVVTRLQGGY